MTPQFRKWSLLPLHACPTSIEENDRAGDRFTFVTNPAATLVKMPVLFGSFGVLFDDPNTPPPATGWRFSVEPYSAVRISSQCKRRIGPGVPGPMIGRNARPTKGGGGSGDV